ncbi:alpha/beta hydrolase fold domain-containing protein [Devriesea agamarum]|uniref:alpha/beta hydrolase fold domain-containing protein n=1 Tax=Devriesea agamarum TaxID=472569 RepID=UPI00071DA767|nr:alpha/beta hydrolase fold domain-containing protein [Devriesea agamarum]
MSRVRRALVQTAGAVWRLPLPDRLYTKSFGFVRQAVPGGSIQRRHAVDVEMIGRARTVWLDRHKADAGIVIHLHGGAYLAGPLGGDWDWLSTTARARDCAGLMIDYRLAPDHRHPVALDDVEAVLNELPLSQRPWVLSGQNAGGGLALVALRRRREAGAALPGGTLLMSPWIDLELNNATMSETDMHDSFHERRTYHAAARIYAARTRLDDPDLSPVGTDLTGLPPLFLAVGTKDIFLTDVRIFRIQLQEQGLDVTYREVGGRLTFIPRLRRGPELDRLLEQQGDFIAKAFARSASAR